MARARGGEPAREGASRRPADRGARRKAYATPRLVEYGSVAKLTQTGGLTSKDSGSMKRTCL